ncbi:MAG: zf-HC2 domain-containing protein [Gemmatimonadaceae bacterium]
MTDCPRTDVRDRLPEWVHGHLGAPEAAVIAAHVRTCAACADEAHLLRQLRSALSVEPRIDVARIAGALARRPSVPQRARQMGAARWKRYAVGAALAAGIATVFLRFDPAPEVATAPAPAAPTIRDSASLGSGGGVGMVAVATGETTSAPPRGGARAPAAASTAGSELVMEGGFAHLADSDLELLLRRLDAVDGVLATAPEPGFGVIPAGAAR